jgi:hypothetical protein
LTLGFSIAADSGQGKGHSNYRGGQANTHMSAKGLENTNAQWSADPDRGWVRAEERHELQERSKTTTKSKQSREKQKGSLGKVVKQ